MLIYLDQNKWIELSRIAHGKDQSKPAKDTFRAFTSLHKEELIKLPLSAIHYIETSRISNKGRKTRLGSTMWEYSRGITIAPYPTIVRHELDAAISKQFKNIEVSELRLIGQGHAHAFGQPPLPPHPLISDCELEKSILIGNELLGLPPPASSFTKHNTGFRDHLVSLHSRAAQIHPSKHENFLYAISTVDIIDPLIDALKRHKLPLETTGKMGESGLKKLVDDMPTRRVDLHLHKQVLQNPRYAAKITDLEDWAALIVAVCYCDVVVCEKHMADMFSRNGFKTRARIETSLAKTFIEIAATNETP